MKSNIGLKILAILPRVDRINTDQVITTVQIFLSRHATGAFGNQKPITNSTSGIQPMTGKINVFPVSLNTPPMTATAMHPLPQQNRTEQSGQYIRIDAIKVSSIDVKTTFTCYILVAGTRA
jgi:hypothetical protein